MSSCIYCRFRATVRTILARFARVDQSVERGKPLFSTGLDDPRARGDGEKMVSCHDVADYFIWKEQDEEASEGITNLKLQKLVYYAQGFYLAIHHKPLFHEPIVAWQHGPVVPDLYHRFKQNGAGPIEPSPDYDPSSLSRESVELMDEVYEVYGQFSGWRLRNMTHQEPTWRRAWEKTAGGESGVIPHNELQAYFATKLV